MGYGKEIYDYYKKKDNMPNSLPNSGSDVASLQPSSKATNISVRKRLLMPDIFLQNVSKFKMKMRKQKKQLRKGLFF